MVNLGGIKKKSQINALSAAASNTGRISNVIASIETVSSSTKATTRYPPTASVRGKLTIETINTAAMLYRYCLRTFSVLKMKRLIMNDFVNVNVKEVFHKFSREKKHPPNGSGLGLSIVKGFTEALGGTVEVKNIPTSGAQFTVTLPVKTSYINTRNE